MSEYGRINYNVQDTPATTYYKAGDKDLYSLFIEKYGLACWEHHVTMEAIQYLWRCFNKSTFYKDIEKVKVICERILQEEASNESR